MTHGLLTCPAASAYSTTGLRATPSRYTTSSSEVGWTMRMASRPGSLTYLRMISGQAAAPKLAASSGFGTVTPGTRSASHGL